MPKSLAERMLLDSDEVQRALGVDVQLLPAQRSGPTQALGDVVGRAATQVAYRSFSGTLEGEDATWPLAVAQMALVFDAAVIAERMFEVVAEAAHMRTTVGRCSVAVETATASNGLVSYWGYLHLAGRLLVVTLDTIDPQAVSMTHFRALVSASTARLESVDPDSVHS